MIAEGYLTYLSKSLYLGSLLLCILVNWRDHRSRSWRCEDFMGLGHALHMVEGTNVKINPNKTSTNSGSGFDVAGTLACSAICQPCVTSVTESAGERS